MDTHRVELSNCLEAMMPSCEAAEAMLRDLREALGKHRGKGSGIARVLRRTAQALAEALEPCIRGCAIPADVADVLRCALGEAVEELQRSLHGVAVRVERLQRLQGETEEELGEALLDTVSAAIGAVCGAARRAYDFFETGKA